MYIETEWAHHFELILPCGTVVGDGISFTATVSGTYVEADSSVSALDSFEDVEVKHIILSGMKWVGDKFTSVEENLPDDLRSYFNHWLAEDGLDLCHDALREAMSGVADAAADYQRERQIADELERNSE